LAGCYLWWLSLSGEGGSGRRDGDEYLRQYHVTLWSLTLWSLVSLVPGFH
jgi:hypothetical protein